MAEFWWGDSPKTKSGITDIIILPAKGNANSILQHMLQGLSETKSTAESCS